MEKSDFFNPKNVSIGTGEDQNKKLPSLLSIGKKNFNGKLSLAIEKYAFSDLRVKNMMRPCFHQRQSQWKNF